MHAITVLGRVMFMMPGIVTALFFLIAAGCNSTSKAPDIIQGYVEGEFVYIAAPLSGRLERLFVQRGTSVKAGEPLFALEDIQEKTAREESKQRLDQIRAEVTDAKKGRRPTEIDAATARLHQAQAALQLSEKELARQERLLKANVVPLQEVDRMRSQRDQDRQRVVQLTADLRTAGLGSRRDQVAAAEANVRALEAVLTRNQWDLAQKKQSAPEAGIVFDTLYRKGEWVPAGRPAVVLLPPANIKVRVFVPQPLLATIHQGDKAAITVDGTVTPYNGTVTFISPRAEYTPPVIYSQDRREKLVFMVELGVNQATAAKLHPGQPVDVRFGNKP